MFTFPHTGVSNNARIDDGDDVDDGDQVVPMISDGGPFSVLTYVRHHQRTLGKAAKQKNAANTNPNTKNAHPSVYLLDTMRFQDDVLRHILQYVGPRNYIFMASVCRQWKKQYHLLHGRRTKFTAWSTAPASLTTMLLYQSEKRQHVPYHTCLIDHRIGKRGNLHMVQWLHARKRLTFSTSFTTGAANGGHLRLLKWLRANGCPWRYTTCTEAAGKGHLHVLKWAQKHGCQWHWSACAFAAKGGHLEVLKWLRANGCEWNAETCSGLAYGGHLEVLKWARKNGCPWNRRTCADAAAGNNLTLLKWARANGCPWGKNTCNHAAREGHLAVLQWARANGCVWNMDTCLKVARKGGHKVVVEWIMAAQES